MNHDSEVGCAGFVFYGPSPTMFITLDAEHIPLLDRLLASFEEEFNTNEDNKAYILHKSPKTILNIFSIYSKKTPLQVIQERIAAEARQLIYYTDKPMKEIADELGFEDAAHFSRFFKNCTSQNPSDLRQNVKQ